MAQVNKSRVQSLSTIPTPTLDMLLQNMYSDKDGISRETVQRLAANIQSKHTPSEMAIEAALISTIKGLEPKIDGLNTDRNRYNRKVTFVKFYQITGSVEYYDTVSKLQEITSLQDWLNLDVWDDKHETQSDQ